MADDKQPEGEEEEGGGGGKKKLFIIIGAVVLLLIIGGAAAFFLMGGEEESAEGEKTEQVEEEALPEKGPPIYHELKPKFIISMLPGGPAKMLQLTVQVFTRHQKAVDFLTANDPMIRHHVINLLEGQDSETLMTLEGKQALQTAIHELLQQKMKEMGERSEIEDVFFTEFVMQ